jgi:hypothetical protein
MKRDGFAAGLHEVTARLVAARAASAERHRNPRDQTVRTVLLIYW